MNVPLQPDRATAARPFVERLVETIEENPRRLRLADLPEDRCVLLLGDPGSGKTTCLRAAAQLFGGEFVPVRLFLARPSGRAAPGAPLFLDALDEALADGPLNPAAAVARGIYEGGAPRFWLSCRPVDWNGLAGEALLADCAGARGLLAVRLLPLDDESVEGFVRSRGQDPDRFLRQVAGAGIVPLLRNPQTLSLMLDVAADGHGLPSSRRALYDRATRVLSAEGNMERPRPPGHRPPPQDAVLDAAGLACTVLILADRDAVALAGVRPGARDVTADDLDPAGERADALYAAIGSRLFAAASERDRWAPQHRTVAEFLAAGFLARRVAEHKLPLDRVLSLVVGRHGEPHPSLRGLFGWLATLLPDRAEVLVRHDPYGVLAYGDPGELRPAALSALLSGLGELERRDPYFRRGLWGEARFAALSAPGLVGGLRQVLEERPWRGHLASCVLEALAEGEPRPELQPTLLSTLCDASLPAGVREDAVPALLNACGGDLGPAAEVLRRLIREPALDESRTLAAHLVVELFPACLGVPDLADFAAYYAVGDGRTGTRDAGELEWRLAGLVPAGQEAVVLDAWAAQDWAAGRRAMLSRAEILGRVARDLLVRALPSLGPHEAVRLVGWLNVVGAVRLGGERDDRLKAALSARPDLFAAMGVAATELAPREARRIAHLANHNLRELAPWWEWPADGGGRLLEAALAETDAFRRELLFVFSLEFCFGLPDLALFDRVYSEARRQPDLAALLERARSCDIPADKDNWRRHHALRRRKAEERNRRERATNLHRLREQLPSIADGTATNALRWLADVWLGGFIASDVEGLPPAERLEKLTDADVVVAAQAGWRRLAAEGELPSPAELGQLRAKGHDYTHARAWVLGADLLFADAGAAVPQLPDSRLVSLLALGLVTTTSFRGGEPARPWVARIAASLPGATHAAVRDLLAPQLAAGREHVDGLHKVCAVPEFASVRQQLVLELLELAKPGPALDTLVAVALRELPVGALLGVIRRRLTETEGLDVPQRWRWLAAGWRLAPVEFEAGVEAAVGEKPELLLDFAEGAGGARFGEGPAGEPLLTLAHRRLLGRVCGPAWPPAAYPVGAYSVPCAADLAAFVARQFEGIASDPSPEAASCLEAFLADPALACHRTMILHALARRRREEIRRGWETPRPAELSAALRAGPPATSADLVAFVEGHLRTLNRELRTTQENRWKGFWDSRSDKPKIENDCRDHLCVLLAARFEAGGLSTQVEARQAGEDRCDIKARSLAATLPVEVKGEWHPELWTAWRDQLGDRYAREPSSNGQGVYLVFWFGRSALKHPISGASVDGPEVLERALQALVDEAGYPLRAVVLDASPKEARKPQGARGVRGGAKGKAKVGAKSSLPGGSRSKGTKERNTAASGTPSSRRRARPVSRGPESDRDW